MTLGPLWRVKLKTAMGSPFARNAEAPVNARRLDMLYQKVHYGHPPVLRLAFGYYAATFNRMPLLSYSKICRAAIQFEKKNQVDRERPFFLGLHNLKIYTVLIKNHLRLPYGVRDWWYD